CLMRLPHSHRLRKQDAGLLHMPGFPPCLKGIVRRNRPVLPRRDRLNLRLMSRRSTNLPPLLRPSASKSRTGRKSPPLAGNEVEDPLTWHDSEITGYNPTDPNDDGYGINGIGFKPTAAMAWARSQKRQRQVAEWKSREAREARERRRERRDGMDLDIIHSVQKGAIQKKVKFDV
ncbi:hypothetical protein BJX96DRAFT_149093, partial [Aspergillus floccosus]